MGLLSPSTRSTPLRSRPGRARVSAVALAVAAVLSLMVGLTMAATPANALRPAEEPAAQTGTGGTVPAALAATAEMGTEVAIPPAPPRYVHDGAGWLNAAQKRRLEEALLQFERETSNQLVVAIFPTLGGEEVTSFTHQVAEQWGMGRKDRDNGILLAFYDREHKLRIEVGYGLEGAITDLISHTIITEEIVPRLRQGDHYGAVQAGVTALMAASRGEYEGSGRALGDRKRKNDMPVWMWVFLLIFLVRIFSRGGRGGRGGPFIFYGGGFGGGSGGGGFSGGGFVGGGGGFGGGGASGSW